MKTLIAVVALSLTAGVAVAAEGNGEPFQYSAPTRVVSLENYKQAPGTSQNPYPFSAGTVPMVANQVLPTNGANGVVQTANSLPPSFADGAPSQTNQNGNAPTAPATRLAQPRPPVVGPRG